MNMVKKLVLAAGLTLLGGMAAFGEYARGYFNNWANDCPLTRPEGGNYYSGTLQAHAGGSSGFRFDLDGNDYYTSFIPTNKFEVGMTVQYYFYVEYTNSSLFGVTSVGTTDQRGSIAYLGDGEGKAHPFQFTVVEPPPVGFNDPQGTSIEDPAVVDWLSAKGFYVDPIENELIDFGDGDLTFDVDSATVSTGGPVTQTVTATFDTYYVWETFFKVAIEPQHAEEPWEDPDPDPEGWEE